MKIYTKTGDEGYTSLFGGARISKDHIRIEAYGTVDELNSFIGVLSDSLDNEHLRTVLHEVQNRLFDIGSVLATDPEKDFHLPSIDANDISLLETEIDAMEEVLVPLKNFILPSGHKSISAAHVCRTVCRRTERRLVSLSSASAVDQKLIQYLNRLSDFFFVLARYIAHDLGIEDTIWKQKNK